VRKTVMSSISVPRSVRTAMPSPAKPSPSQ
jgi:hypothetical protein